MKCALQLSLQQAPAIAVVTQYPSLLVKCVGLYSSSSSMLGGLFYFYPRRLFLAATIMCTCIECETIVVFTVAHGCVGLGTLVGIEHSDKCLL